ncbi:DNA segregation ATPase FtsK/SpoIIIE, S-DNA-T family, partial [Streptococcus gallolyticus]
LRGQDDVVSLNLHERAHGPHGLIAGTTGSGKSELIQSYILSLAVNFHPYDVAFLLIDYKGGGMANLFKDLPHLLGTITNLDGAQAMRALTSINAEIHRRERLFAANGVNHINQYQKKYKLGEVAEPLPHLFLISDEFAELKQEQPDFMSALVSTARTGRSLGIHLILATQKPAGVVNDQIWSNSRFKIALKVADRQDSNEMLHTPDAAEITQTGRAYLQVGNNEVYELFQSAWSGADYQPDKDDQGIEDQTIYAINALGQYDILNDDLSGLEDVEDIRQVPSELDAIVHHLHDLTQTLNPLARPWLPPLATRVYSQDLCPERFQDLWQQSTGSLKALIGLVDLPSQQAQKVCYHDFEVDGNVVLFSAPGNGKSTFLQTLTMDLARQNTPELLHCYLFDFGTNGLLPLRSLPHVADSFMMEDSEKITKFILRMKTEMATRKKRFSQYGVSNIKLYRQLSGEQLPEILIMIDSYDGIKEAETGEALEAMLQTLLRDGASLGINVAITAGRIGVLKSALLQSLKTRLTLKTSDDNDTKTIIGRHDYLLEDIPGRGILKYDDVEVFQTALPARGEDSVAMLQALQEEAEEMAAAWTGARPSRIPVVPEKLSLEDFMAKPSVQEALHNNELPIGLDMIHVENVSISLNHFRQLAYVSDNEEALQSITSHLLKVLMELPNPAKIMLLDTAGDYTHFKEDVRTYVANEEELPDLVKQLLDIFEERQTQPLEEQEPWFIVIPNLQTFIQESDISEEDWVKLFNKAHQVKLYLIVGGSYQYLGISGDAQVKKS